MSATGAGLFEARVMERVSLSPSTRLVVLERPVDFPDALPGQFVSVRIGDSSAPLLRRPYSICDLTATTLSLLVKIVGPGSRALAEVKPQGTVDLLGPLGGAPFPDTTGRDAVYVAGGTGLAPILFTLRRRRRSGAAGKAILLYGAECGDEILHGLFEGGPSETWCATIDGSCQYCGDVVSLCEKLLAERRLPTDLLLSCGPRAMVRALVDRVEDRFADHYTSLETIMACGVGACRGCTVPVLSGGAIVMKAVCSDGTVFRAREIAWKEWID